MHLKKCYKTHWSGRQGLVGMRNAELDAHIKLPSSVMLKKLSLPDTESDALLDAEETAAWKKIGVHSFDTTLSLHFVCSKSIEPHSNYFDNPITDTISLG